MTQRPVSVIQLRRDTATNWTANNPVLRQGEPGYDTTNKELKIGDGSTAWNSLNSATPGTFDITAVPVVNDLLVWDGSKWVNKTYANAGLATTTELTTGLSTKANIASPTFTNSVGVAVSSVPVVTIGGDSNGSIELGKINGSTSTPFIDFHSAATPSDYNVRIIANGGTSTAGDGTLTITAGQLTLPNKTYAPGSVVQVATKRTSTRSAYSFNNDVIISALNVSITPKFASSLLLVQWWVNYESDYNAVFRVYRDSALITTSGYQGYNENDGNTWSGVAALQYDTNVDSTPNSQLIQHFVPALSTAATTLQLTVRSSSATASTFYLNRSFMSAGGSAYEIMVSNAVVWEIAQ